MSEQFTIVWLDSGREPQCPPNPDYPNGIDVPSPRHGEAGFKFCTVTLPYPAKRCGSYVIECTKCGFRVGITTAGRPDDPRSVELECQG
jgi:hypothetical protein